MFLEVWELKWICKWIYCNCLILVRVMVSEEFLLLLCLLVIWLDLMNLEVLLFCGEELGDV